MLSRHQVGNYLFYKVRVLRDVEIGEQNACIKYMGFPASFP